MSRAIDVIRDDSQMDKFSKIIVYNHLIDVLGSKYKDIPLNKATNRVLEVMSFCVIDKELNERK